MPPVRLRPVQPVRLFTQVVDQVLALIEAGELTPGDRLPAERDLAERFQVSRASVRQALTALEVSGAVQVKAGSGVYVSQTIGQLQEAAAAMTEAAGPLEILESRSLFEPGVARLAAIRRTDADLDQMANLVDALREELALGREGWEADWGFHEALGRATRNPSVQRVCADLREQMQQPVWALMRARNLERSSRAQRYLKDHADILRAIKKGDADRSEALMLRHIGHVVSDLDTPQNK